MSLSLDEFEKTSLEVGQWCWGKMQGAFNEKQSISQIITDAAIGMIPVVGDVTAVRDLLAVSIGMARDPRKREEVMEWVMLVVLVFALIPVVGGVIKGVGRLALRAAGDAAKDEKLLQEVIAYLNRVGHGDAPKWLRALDVRQYQAQLVEKLKSFCSTVRRTIEKTLESHVGSVLPEQWHGQLQMVADGFGALPQEADKMVPKALDALNEKIRVLQNTAYEGEKHVLATGGAPKVARETEAELKEEVKRPPAPRGKYASIRALVEDEEGVAVVKARLGPYIAKGWPDLFHGISKMPVFGSQKVYKDIASFHGAITAVTSRELAGKTIYRAFGKASRVTPAGESAAGGFWGAAYWGVGEAPKTAKAWREGAAVLDDWNANGFMVVAHLPDNLAEILPEAKAWIGRIAEQYSPDAPFQYLEGGAEQLVANFGKDVVERITAIGNEVKAAGSNAVRTEMIGGVRFEFFKTNWSDVERVHGYGEAADHGAATTRKLADDEVREK
ncbi:hypothetical protein [Paraburkholderia guartelaensis]|uniref:hypothetical protein n=1 Tax=Paraburkholderia guartelaensis TaxID=2546446 RepID=UPI002AB71707|nr:hypothetical protein [Paraburkholderia guartelaensis]